MAAAEDEATGGAKRPIGPRVLPGDVESTEQAEPYYWEDGADEDVSTTTAVMHNLHWWGALALAGVDSVGGVLASGLGLTQSRYQFEIDYAERKRAAIRQRIIARRQRELLVDEERRRREQAARGGPVDSRSAAKAVSDRIQRREREERARRRAEDAGEESEDEAGGKTFFEAAAELEAGGTGEAPAAVAPSAGAAQGKDSVV